MVRNKVLPFNMFFFYIFLVNVSEMFLCYELQNPVVTFGDPICANRRAQRRINREIEI